MSALTSYTKADIAALQQLDRQQVFAVLGSFDTQGLPAVDAAWRTLALLDPQRIPGLAEARAAGDLARAGAAVMAACARGGSDLGTAPLSAEVRQAAEAALRHEFTFYGETHQLPSVIDWEENPGTGHWGHDLNRFTYLVPLTRAYLATGDTRYSRKAVTLIQDWIAAADFGCAFHIERYVFGSYLNLALHASEWCQALRQLLPHGQVQPEELLRVLKSLHEHVAYLAILTNGDGGNWPTIGCMGMLKTLETFPIYRDTDAFAAYCRQTMTVQIREQVLPDGAQDELTPHYHQVVINQLVSSLESLRALGSDYDAEMLATLRRMVQFQQQLVVPDGSKQVTFNDGDPATVRNLAQQLRPLGLEGYLRTPAELGPECFPYAGVAVLRQRQDQGDRYLAFDAGPFGRGHQHEDKLGFWLFAYGRNLLVDPGRHLYDNSSASFYAYLRSTRAHSTILVDGEGQHSAAFPATWIARAPLDLGWQVSPNEVRAAGCYDLGYGLDNAIQVTHRREIVFVDERCWVVFDTLTGAGTHTIESRFQFAPGTVLLDAERAYTDFPDANLLLWPVATRPITRVGIEEGQEQPRGGWYSDGYNQIEPAPAVAYTVEGAALPLHIATLLFPYRGTTRPTVMFAFDGQVATIEHPELGRQSVTPTDV